MPTCSGIINQLRFTLLQVSIGIFLAGESKGRGGTIPSRQPHPWIAAKIGSWIGISQVQESKGFFSHGKTTPQYLSVWEPNSRGCLGQERCLWHQWSCSGMPSWRIQIYFPRKVPEAAAFQAGAEERKPLGMGQIPTSLLQGSSEGCVVSCLCTQHSRNILKDKSHVSLNSVLYWESTRQRNGVWRNLNFTEILQEASILWQWYPHGESKRFPENLGILRRSCKPGWGNVWVC